MRSLVKFTLLTLIELVIDGPAMRAYQNDLIVRDMASQG
jgi:hypothetical protein